MKREFLFSRFFVGNKHYVRTRYIESKAIQYKESASLSVLVGWFVYVAEHPAGIGDNVILGVQNAPATNFSLKKPLNINLSIGNTCSLPTMH